MELHQPKSPYTTSNISRVTPPATGVAPSAVTTTSVSSPNASTSRNNSLVVLSQKSNHVSTVLLYGIPIVSLYIEGQERLCLAQISNTLLKQFSYNEIHNRRVALGITCVQCTPVQLEILRRAGAMPVSSRRCGMITRREAERLCKSFLGDNAPPRLPDDFAFSVHHKCAWGCRGSFLPSRYNSSRAKCIKCSYCGMFFSPNKFIFHSHRVSANDKYVQPDAANFNSWRRHMLLSGQPPEEITHAWEDVKAMFNGGTRKRLMQHNSSSMTSSPLTLKVSSNNTNSIINQSGEMSQAHNSNTTKTSPNRNDIPSHPSPKRSRDHGLGPVTSQVPNVSTMRPLNIHQPTTVAPSQTRSAGISEHENSLIPFSRSFMMDYMWHAHAAQQQQQQHKVKSGSSTSAFSFPNCTLSWIKASGALPPTISGSGNNGGGDGVGNGSNCHLHDTLSYTNVLSSKSSFRVSSSPDDAVLEKNLSPLNKSNNDTCLPHLLTASAFKPVLQQNQKHTLNAVGGTTTSLASSSVYSGPVSASASVSSMSSLASSSSSSSSSSASSAAAVTAAAASVPNNEVIASNVAASIALSVNTNCASPSSLLFPHPPSRLLIAGKNNHNEAISPPRMFPTRSVVAYIKESHSSDDENADAEDDEMVDIETTEDETLTQNLHLISSHLRVTSCSPSAHYHTATSSPPHPPSTKYVTSPSSSYSIHSKPCINRCNSCIDDIVDVEGIPENDEYYNQHVENTNRLGSIENRDIMSTVRGISPASQFEAASVMDTVANEDDNNDREHRQESNGITTNAVPPLDNSCSSSNESIYRQTKIDCNATSSLIEIVESTSSTNSLANSVMWTDLLIKEKNIQVASKKIKLTSAIATKKSSRQQQQQHVSSMLSDKTKLKQKPQLVDAKDTECDGKTIEKKDSAERQASSTIETMATAKTYETLSDASKLLRHSPNFNITTTTTTTSSTTTTTNNAVLFEALTHCNKTDSTYNNNNNNNNNNINNFNKNNSNSSHHQHNHNATTNSNNNNNNEFWHVASRLYLQRPLCYDITNLAPLQQQHHLRQQHLQRVPLYYRQQQQQHQQATLQQAQQLQQLQPNHQHNSHSNPNSHHQNDLLSMEKSCPINNFRYLEHETPTRANGVG